MENGLKILIFAYIVSTLHMADAIFSSIGKRKTAFAGDGKLDVDAQKVQGNKAKR